jgi:hypothetical protein
MKNVVVLASVRENARGFVHKVALLEGEPTETHRAEGVAE